MSPNAMSFKSTNFQIMKMNKMSDKRITTYDKKSSYVPIERLFFIARKLAELELSDDKLVDTCVSLLDTNYDCNHIYDFNSNEKSYCEVVSVPSSTHVAQIVGKQGSKIKSLRTKYRTYIQTPVTGEEPVFIITGHREDVLKAKAEIMSISAHFTSIGDKRQEKLKENVDIPGGISLNLITPSCLIGLIVGRNGNTIRKLQENTKTYIETPKMIVNSSFAAFTVSGQRLNVDYVVHQIIDHVKSKNPERRFATSTLPNGDLKLDLID